MAVYPSVRGRGAGSAALRRILDLGKPVVLEVEIPRPSSKRLEQHRRIEFYKRHGFTVQPYPYYQPAYDGSGKKVPLAIMANTPGPLPEEEFVRIRNGIFKIVHGIDAPLA